MARHIFFKVSDLYREIYLSDRGLDNLDASQIRSKDVIEFKQTVGSWQKGPRPQISAKPDTGPENFVCDWPKDVLKAPQRRLPSTTEASLCLCRRPCPQRRWLGKLRKAAPCLEWQRQALQTPCRRVIRTFANPGNCSAKMLCMQFFHFCLETDVPAMLEKLFKCRVRRV